MRILFLAALLSSAFGAVVLAAQDQPTAKPTADKSAPANKLCPVEPDHEVDAKFTAIHAGKIVGFCCRDCIDEFRKEPKKYMEKLK